MSGGGATGIAPQRTCHLGLPHQCGDRLDELADIARCAEHGPLVGDDCATLRIVGAERRRQHLPDLFEIARHNASADSHVLEDFGRRPKELAVNHVRAVRRHEDVARAEQTRAFLTFAPPLVIFGVH